MSTHRDIDGVIADYSKDQSFCTFTTCCTTLALYNVVEINVLVVTIFKRHNHLYFWSLVIASWGVVLYAVGFFLKFLKLADVYCCIAISGIGWWCMVTGQSVVLYSRLNLLLSQDTKTLKWLRWMIVTNAIVFHPSTTTTAFGSNSHASATTVHRFVEAYKVLEKAQLTSFCVQEFILSSIYLYEALRYSKVVQHKEGRSTVRQLLCVNVVLILMDIGLLSVEFANLYAVQIVLKGVVYSIKLKLEMAVLGQLIRLVAPRLNDLAVIGGDPSSNVTTSGSLVCSIGARETQQSRGPDMIEKACRDCR